MQRRKSSAPFARVHSRMTVNGPALWANVKRANAYSEAKRNLSTTLRHRRLRFTEQSLLLWMWMWQVG